MFREAKSCGSGLRQLWRSSLRSNSLEASLSILMNGRLSCVMLESIEVARANVVVVMMKSSSTFISAKSEASKSFFTMAKSLFHAISFIYPLFKA